MPLYWRSSLPLQVCFISVSLPGNKISKADAFTGYVARRRLTLRTFRSINRRSPKVLACQSDNVNVATSAISEPRGNGAKRTRFRPSKRLMAFVAYIGISGAIISALEGWSLLDAFYFAVVTATTVGYGDLVPRRNITKVFVCGYAVLSCCLIATLLSSMVSSVIDTQSALGVRLQNALSGHRHGLREESAIPEGQYLVRNAEAEEVRARNRCIATGVLLLVACVLGAIMYGLLLQKLSPIDTLFLLVATLTTVGYGDVHPETRAGKFFAVAWLVFSSIGLANLLSQYSEWKVCQRHTEMAREVMSSRMSEQTYNTFDENRDGMLDETEYLAFVLTKMEKTTSDEIAAIRERFSELDQDGNGLITKNELDLDF